MGSDSDNKKMQIKVKLVVGVIFVLIGFGTIPFVMANDSGEAGGNLSSILITVGVVSIVLAVMQMRKNKKYRTKNTGPGPTGTG